MKRKAYEEAGLPVSLSSTIKVVPSSSEVQQHTILESQLPVVSESLHVKLEKSTGNQERSAFK